MDAVEKYFIDKNLPGYQILKKDPFMLSLLFKAFFWRSQLIIIKGLYIEKFIPAAETLDEEVQKEVNQSDNYGLILDFQEVSSVYETIRFGYLAMYHKYESFYREYFPLLAKYFKKDVKEIRKLFKEKLDFNVEKPEKGIIYKFCWISDCFKHQNSIASDRNDPPSRFIDYPKNTKIFIDPIEFKNDCDLFILEYNKIIQSTILVATFMDNEMDNEIISDKIKQLIKLI